MKKRRVKKSDDEDVGVVVRNWGSLPGRVRRRMVQIARAYDPQDVAVPFPTPKGATWSDVVIEFIAPEWVRVRVLKVKYTYTFARIGLADKRRPEVARAEWKMLRTYAENPDPGAYDRLPKRPNLKMDISKFRRWLKEFFGIAGDPLLPFKSCKWMPRFKIRVREKQR